MALLLTSFIAGVLTVLAPCVLPLLPIIIGGAAQDQGRRNPYVITAALAVSIVLFTLLLKFSTLFISVPQSVWSTISGIIIIAFGLVSLFPNVWTRINVALGLQTNSDKLLESAAKKPGTWGDILLGLSFGPVFSSCSPTYFVILATVLPQSFGLGVVYLAVYAAGLSLVLLLISLLGQKFVQRIRWAADPNGWFKKSLGIIFILVGLFILTGADKRLQTFLLDNGYFNITNFEYQFLPEAEPEQNSLNLPPGSYPKYQEIASPSGFVNTEAITLGELIGKKIILVDFMTYSCINCIRTFPYLNDWYDKYRDQGLEIVGIHTPEFAFEKDLGNVVAAMEKYGIQFPVVLDNDYATWSAYKNNYWPRKYLIDYNGQIVYDHIGEGAYQETEAKIQELLGLTGLDAQAGNTQQVEGQRCSPETYCGAERNSLLYNGVPGKVGPQMFMAPDDFPQDVLVLDGPWDIQPEYAQPLDDDSRAYYRFHGKDMFIVASAEQPTTFTLTRDNLPLTAELAGSDVTIDSQGSRLNVFADQLYSAIKNDDNKTHLVSLSFTAAHKPKIFTFTFGN